MSGYQELRDLGAVFRPMDGAVPSGGGNPSPFDAPWSSTVDLLARELRHLDASQIVIEIHGLEERDLRVDGLPRANARPLDGVRLSFQSKHGPLQYETAEFTQRYYGQIGWQSNLRAIALGLEALRKVDRYGVSRRGEQYKGWRQLPISTDPADAIQTLDQARAVIAEASGFDLTGTSLDSAIRVAVKKTHPDAGGNPDDFRRVMKAKELIAG